MEKPAPSVLSVENPFCTRRVRPGAIPFIFAAGDSPQSLLAQFQRDGCRGEIVGRHGAGKSTLLATLLPAWRSLGQTVELVQLHDSQRTMAPESTRRFSTLPAGAIIVVDGYEQLGWFARRRLQRLCRRRRIGLLVTSHRSTGLPTLVQVEPDVRLAIALVERLTEAAATAAAQERVVALFHQCGGDMRETLFALYDDFQQRRD